MVSDFFNLTTWVKINYHALFFPHFFCIFYHEKGAKKVPFLDPLFWGKFSHFWLFHTALRPFFFSDFFEKMVIYHHYGSYLMKISVTCPLSSIKYVRFFQFSKNSVFSKNLEKSQKKSFLTLAGFFYFLDCVS